MKRMLPVFLWLLVSCTSAPVPSTSQPVAVYSTSAAQPWLAPLYDCAGTSVTLSRVDDASSAEIVLRLGEPELLDGFAYQIDTEQILIATGPQSQIQDLTLAAARALFTGQGDSSAQVWVYASGEDVQQVFEQAVMAGGSVSPSARLAADSQQMADTLDKESNAVGILPRHWKRGEVREALTVATVPVLALTNSEPQGGVQQLIACLQK